MGIIVTSSSFRSPWSYERNTFVQLEGVLRQFETQILTFDDESFRVDDEKKTSFDVKHLHPKTNIKEESTTSDKFLAK